MSANDKPITTNTPALTDEQREEIMRECIHRHECGASTLEYPLRGDFHKTANCSWCKQGIGCVFVATPARIAAYVAQKVREERERCAQIADGKCHIMRTADGKIYHNDVGSITAFDIAAAIRKEPTNETK